MIKQKQEVKKNYKIKHYKFKKKNYTKRVLKSKRYSPYKNLKIKTKKKKIINYLYLKITSNNIFCTLTRKIIKEKKNLVFKLSSGVLKVKISRKRIKFASKVVISLILKKYLPVIKKNLLLINISVPKNVKKFVISFLSQKLLKHKRKKWLLNIEHKKCFNGCRYSKRRRLKRKRNVLRL
jgi:ribosomal protein S11